MQIREASMLAFAHLKCWLSWSFINTTADAIGGCGKLILPEGA